MQEHVHHTQSPGGTVRLLAVQGPVCIFDEVGCLDQERTGTTGRITDCISGLRFNESCQEFGNFSRSIELTTFLSGIGSKSGNQVFVCIANDIKVSDSGRTKVQTGIMEIRE